MNNIHMDVNNIETRQNCKHACNFDFKFQFSRLYPSHIVKSVF